ncbi:NnrU family protein [Agrobacterium rosae]|uniref:NnrU family protein n=1 Tax=Agrobacterium rosae TaxID=1972867 RepID=A0AAE5S115_9HYPH|nr:NnrU family protein [Agrobacterium rosae]KAA3513272.1 NnrU family protein [Agrobacterium rosae]KAA3521244.1 NnrU family protein [Agrobacterium rosae]MCM2432928.1 NnrU family protein [Agrobacterium rosae]MDX8328003.1 NnrU family protein [Agrobacterium rosae]MQB48114.1 NnrU family protein [Agrobacterium rosae]
MLLLILSLLFFLGTHSLRIVAPDFRNRMIARMGEGPWKGVYSLVSVIAIAFVAYAFDQARQVTGILYSPPIWTSHIALTLMLIAMICLVASLVPAGHIATKTKHPLILAVKIWALAHLLANGETSSVLLFVSVLAWGVVMRISLKRRQRAGEVVTRPFVSARYDIVAVVLGIVLWAAFIWKLHEWLIGVQPLAM